MPTAPEQRPQQALTPGARILVREEEWLVRTASPAYQVGDKEVHEVRAIGVTELVQGIEATFFTDLDKITVMSPEDTKLVSDDSPRFRRSRLFLEAVIRRTPLPRSEKGLALADRFLLDPLTYQQRPAELALSTPAPRLLIADVVGLGKTLEIGLTLAELIRRGRGERILVVTPQHILEQFQHELWTRFSIPLVRLDSVGIQRIQREIPAGRNPFTYFKRVIVSIDTLKNVGMYGHHLEASRWDAVVIDESHNLIGENTLRKKLAKKLAATTDALIFASATPHNGDRKSFAELIRMLDSAAIPDEKSFTAKDIEHVYIRRTKVSREVRDQMGGKWAEREIPQPVLCPAGPAEEAVFAELTQNWLQPAESQRAKRAEGLFAYTLLKAHLSSPEALRETIKNRLGSSQGSEREALIRLRDLNDAITSPAKLTALIDELKAAGIKPGGTERVVVFSERVATLKWLASVVPPRLGLPAEAVRLMHGGISDTEQQRIVEEFSLAGSPVRLLFTGDIASEGVNLHRECRTLIHFDIPWSLIRIEQRNGRIDRYGQLRRPRFRALLLSSKTPGAKDDYTVSEKLLNKEQQAHESIGTVEPITGLFDAKKEEERLIRDLLEGKTAQESLDALAEPDVLGDLLASVGEHPVIAEPPRAKVPTLFASTEAFVLEALRELYDDHPEDAIGLRQEEQMLALTAPDDLIQRLSDLPRSYLADHLVDGELRLRLTFDRSTAQRHLDEARKEKKTIWPRVGFVSDIHPLVDWLVDRVLIRLGRQEAPVLEAEVAEPVFLVQGVLADDQGRPVAVRYLAVDGLKDRPTVRPMEQVLEAAKVGPQMANRGLPLDPSLQDLLPAALDAARAELAGVEREGAVGEPLLRVLAVLRRAV